MQGTYKRLWAVYNGERVTHCEVKRESSLCEARSDRTVSVSCCGARTDPNEATVHSDRRYRDQGRNACGASGFRP